MDEAYDVQLKILLVGDSGVGKSSLLLRFTDRKFDDLTPTIGVDFKTKIVEHNDLRIKLTLWDTAGQERFRTLTSSYYRGAQGIIYVYDVTRAETMESIKDIWMKEVDLYSTVEGAVQMIVANKIDMDEEREVSHKQGVDLAKRCGCLFVETSAKINVAVEQAFNELVLKILDSPQLARHTGVGGGVGGLQQRDTTPRSTCC